MCNYAINNPPLSTEERNYVSSTKQEITKSIIILSLSNVSPTNSRKGEVNSSLPFDIFPFNVGCKSTRLRIEACFLHQCCPIGIYTENHVRNFQFSSSALK